MSVGYRHYGNIRSLATKWMNKVEIDISRIDDLPITFSGGMLQRLQIAKNLITSPNVIFMDEPTGGLDVSVQARVLDLIRSLVNELNLTVIIVSHDLAVIRLLADKMIVMKNGTVIESGLSDQVLEDPQQEYTQLLVSSVLHV
jgi:putative phosphonate transport system ATP-binding protein